MSKESTKSKGRDFVFQLKDGKQEPIWVEHYSLETEPVKPEEIRATSMTFVLDKSNRNADGNHEIWLPITQEGDNMNLKDLKDFTKDFDATQTRVVDVEEHNRMMEDAIKGCAMSRAQAASEIPRVTYAVAEKAVELRERGETTGDKQSSYFAWQLGALLWVVVKTEEGSRIIMQTAEKSIRRWQYVSIGLLVMLLLSIFAR